MSASGCSNFHPSLHTEWCLLGNEMHFQMHSIYGPKRPTFQLQLRRFHKKSIKNVLSSTKKKGTMRSTLWSQLQKTFQIMIWIFMKTFLISFSYLFSLDLSSLPYPPIMISRGWHSVMGIVWCPGDWKQVKREATPSMFCTQKVDASLFWVAL